MVESVKYHSGANYSRFYKQSKIVKRKLVIIYKLIKIPNLLNIYENFKRISILE